MRRIYCWLAPLVLIAALPGRGLAQAACDPARTAVAGVVADLLSRNPLPGSVVTIEEPAPFSRQIVGRAIAQADGRFVVCVDAVGTGWEAFAQIDTLRSRAVPVSSAGAVDTLFINGSEAVTISGTVRTLPSGAPLEGARVAIENRRVRAITDGNGRFSFRGVGGGPIVVTTSHIGYAGRSDTILAGSGAAIDLDITIGEEAVELEPIVVTARTPPSTRIRAPRDLGMTAEEVAAALDRSIDFLSLLRQANVPGLQIRGDTSGGVCIEFLRSGGGCSMLAVYVNGIRMSNPSVWITTVDPSSVEEFFVLRPAFAQFQYMNAANGVLDITLR